jgi:signal transduction histidine kinase
MPRISRTAIALGLTLAAVGIPAGALWVRGSADVDRTIERIEKEPRDLARLAAQRLARRIGWGLEELRRTESQRPYYQYQALMHDPRGISEGIALSPSPLAEGTGDPLVDLWFQVEPDGRVSSPFFEAPSGAEPSGMAPPAPESPARVRAREALESLQASAPLLNRLSATPETQEAVERMARELAEERRVASAQAAPGAPAGTGEEKTLPGLRAKVLAQAQIQSLDDSAYYQNVNSAQLARDLQRPATPSARERLATGRRVSEKSVSVVVGTLAWKQIDRAGAPALVALRRVVTPTGAFTQGFLIARERIEASYSGGTLPARLLPGRPIGSTEARLPLEGVDWHIAVDPTPLYPIIGERGDALRRRFVSGFATATSLALLVGLLVVFQVRRAEQTAAERSRFAASAAHELRTPLASLRLYAEMLAEGLGDPARGREYARSIADEAERLGRVVSNVLGFSRIERGALTVRAVPGDLGEGVRRIVARLAPVLEAHGSRVETSIAAPLPPVAFDPDALDQILRNLLDNAGKFGARAADRTVHVSVAPAEGAVVLDVRDHGPGVPDAERRKLFRPFARSADRDAPPGLGLGLAMVQALAAAHGGRAEFVAPPEGGAQFQVRFPSINT